MPQDNLGGPIPLDWQVHPNCDCANCVVFRASQTSRRPFNNFCNCAGCHELHRRTLSRNSSLAQAYSTQLTPFGRLVQEDSTPIGASEGMAGNSDFVDVQPTTYGGGGGGTLNFSYAPVPTQYQNDAMSTAYARLVNADNLSNIFGDRVMAKVQAAEAKEEVCKEDPKVRKYITDSLAGLESALELIQYYANADIGNNRATMLNRVMELNGYRDQFKRLLKLPNLDPNKVNIPSRVQYTTEEAWLTQFGQKRYEKRPVHAVFQVRTKKTVITYTSKKDKHLFWTRQHEMEYQKVITELNNKHSGARSAAERILVGQYRAARQKKWEVLYEVTAKRGKYKKTAVGYGLVSTIQEAKQQLNVAINHDRNVMRGHKFAEKRNRVGLSRYAGVYTEKNAFFDVWVAQKSKIRDQKKPKTKANYVGVEIEFISKLTTKQLTILLYQAGLGEYVELKSDGSLRVSRPNDTPHELCILVTEDKYREVITNVCKLLIANSSYVNDSCGLHVHLDMRHRDPKESYDRLRNCLNVLYAIIPPNRRENKYCKRNEFNSTFDTYRGGDQRYTAINANAFERHKTLEVRMHSGTLSPRKIGYWIELLLLILSKPNAVKFKRMERFIEVFNARPELSKYLFERMEKFNEEGIDDDDEHKLAKIEVAAATRPDRGCGCEYCRRAAQSTAPTARDQELPDYSAELDEAA